MELRRYFGNNELLIAVRNYHLKIFAMPSGASPDTVGHTQSEN